MNKYFGVGRAGGKLYLVERVREPSGKEDRAQMVYEFIEAYLAIEKRPPVYREIAKYTGMPYSTISYWLKRLAKDGKTKQHFGIARGITLCKNS